MADYRLQSNVYEQLYSSIPLSVQNTFYFSIISTFVKIHNLQKSRHQKFRIKTAILHSFTVCKTQVSRYCKSLIECTHFLKHDEAMLQTAVG